MDWLLDAFDSRSVLTVLFIAVVWLLYHRYHHHHAHRRSLDGLSVLITGCDTGLGRHLALHLQSVGMVVHAGCLTQRAVQQLTTLALSSLHPIQLDVTSSASTTAAIRHITAAHSPVLHCLINNAGVFDTFLCELTPIESYERCMDVNFLGAVRVTQQCAPLLRAGGGGRVAHGGGRVISVGSFLGTLSSWSLSGYSASKWALEAWHDSVRSELGMFGVQCMLLQPGTMRTQLVSEVGAVYRRRWAEGSERVRAEYGDGMVSVIPAVERIMALLSSDTSGVVQEVERQLRRQQMDSRVRVGWDSRLCGMVPYLPISDRMMDWLLAVLVSIPTPAAVSRAGDTVK